jgi:hypothetical protein
MKQSEIYRLNAENCAYLAGGTLADDPIQRFIRLDSGGRCLTILDQ